MRESILLLTIGSLLVQLLAAGCGQEQEPEPQVEAVSAEKPVLNKKRTFKGREYTITPLPPGVRTLGEVRSKALEVLDRVVDREASKVGNAWALAHGILVRGPDFKASDGRRAVDVLVDDYLLAEPLAGAKGLQPYFPKLKGQVRVEPHTDLILKTFVEVGMPLDEPLTSRAGSPTLERLLRSSRMRFVSGSEGSFFADVDDVAWSAQAWCQAVYKGAAPSWRTAAGMTLKVDDVAREQLELIEREYHFIQRARAAGETVEKRRQHIFAHACGGAHLLQGTIACAAVEMPVVDSLESRIKQLIDAYLWRIPLEVSLVDRAVQSAPRLIPILLNQDIKFLGHGLELLAKAELAGLWTPDAEQLVALQGMEDRLLNHVLQLNGIKVYDAEKMTSLSKREHGFQLYLDLVGDACHARLGLQLQERLRVRRGAASAPLIAD
ncbi:MAG: hypothetical protein CMP23_09405 [Rickettsiales bacterium]|nr:hypothetical protein [Rickettsiales bacterium]